MTHRKVAAAGILVFVVVGILMWWTGTQSAQTPVPNTSSLWVATVGQLFKLDPTDGSSDAQPANTSSIERLAVDESDGTVWGYKRGNLSAYDNAGKLLFSSAVPQTAAASSHIALTVNTVSGHVWLAVGRKLYHFNDQGQLLKTLALEDEAQDLSFDPHSGRLWVATETTVKALDANGALVHALALPKKSSVTALAVDRLTGSLWVARSDKLELYSSAGTRLFQKTLPGISRLADDNEYGVWAAAGVHLLRISATGQTLVDRIPLLLPIDSMAVDRSDHSVWIGGLLLVRHFDAAGRSLRTLTLLRILRDLALFIAPVPQGNRPPLAVNDSATTAVDTAVPLQVLSNDSDPDGDALKIVSITQGTSGTVTNTNTVVTYKPGAGFHGTDSFTYTIDDGRGGHATAKVNITVDQAPQVNAGADQTITLPATATLNGTVTDDGLPNPPAITTTTWSKISNNPGTVTFGNAHIPNTTAAFSQAGTYVLRLTANDGFLTAADDVQITVAPATNRPPLFTSSPVTTAAVGRAYSYDADAIDPDAGDTLTFSLTTAPTGMSIDAATGLIQWTPTNAQAGANNVSVRVQDSGGLFASQDFTVQVQVLEGVLLAGAPNTLASASLIDLPPVGVEPSQIVNGIIMTRLDVRLSPDGTVGQLNAALTRVGGGIVSMARGFLALTIAVPRQATVENLLALITTLRAQPGIAFAKLAREAGLMELPGSRPLGVSDIDGSAHLLPSRFPAAWNAGDSLVSGTGCNQQKVTVLIPDIFGAVPAEFDSQVPASSFQFASGAPVSGVSLHGYTVTKILAATGLFTGANPFPECLTLRAIQTAGLSEYQGTIDIANNFPADKFIVTYSQGYSDDCIALGPDPVNHPELAREICIPPKDPTIALPADRAQDSLFWKEYTRGRWNDFLVAVSAGNSRDTDAPNIYLGTGDSRYTNKMAIGQLPDTLFSFVEDPTLWSPSSAGQVAAGFQPLFNAGDAAAAALLVRQAGLETAIADNVLVVGGTTTVPGATILTQGSSPALVSEAAFSETGPDVKAVAEDVFHCGSLQCAGTSVAAPQVAGLASYLWLLSPALRNLPSAVTRQAIVANAWNGIGSASGLIDAYATVLSLDSAAPPTPASAPIRKAILNVNTGGASRDRFDEADIAEFLNHFFFDANGNPVIEPAAPDYNRYDLNGDGFTGGSRKARFDLDRAGSTQFGQTNYSTITQAVEGNLLEFNKGALTDLDILCYYAYSDLYEGDRDVRRQLLSQLPGNQRCVFSVKPRTVTLTTGQTQQFEAIGVPNGGAVTWTASGGAIDPNTGLFTAGGAGTVTVRATTVADASVFAEATVTVPGSILTGQLGFAEVASGFSSNLSAFVRAEVRADGTIAVLQATGSQNSTATSQGGCYDPNSPDPNNPNVLLVTLTTTQNITFDGGEYIRHAPSPSEDTLNLNISSGSYAAQDLDPNNCNISTITGTISGSASLLGKPVLQNGQLVAVDFNRDFSIAGESRLQTGRLELQ